MLYIRDRKGHIYLLRDKELQRRCLQWERPKLPGRENYIVTTMECYKDILPDLRSGKFAKHMREQFPESSNYFGIMVAIPDWAETTDELEKPTPLDAEVRQWKLAVNIAVPLWTEKALHDRIIILHVAERTLRRKNY